MNCQTEETLMLLCSQQESEPNLRANDQKGTIKHTDCMSLYAGCLKITGVSIRISDV